MKKYKNTTDTILVYSFVLMLFLFVSISFMILPHGKTTTYNRCKCPKEYIEKPKTFPDATILCEPKIPFGKTSIIIKCVQ